MRSGVYGAIQYSVALGCSSRYSMVVVVVVVLVLVLVLTPSTDTGS